MFLGWPERRLWRGDEPVPTVRSLHFPMRYSRRISPHLNRIGVLICRRATGCSSATNGWRPPPTAPSMSSLRSPRRCTRAHPTGHPPTSTGPSPPHGRRSTTVRGPTSTPEERADAIAALSQALQKRAAEIAEVVTNENGAPAQQSMGTQVFAATMVLDIYADIARTYPWSDERVGAMGQKVVVRRAPVGVCAGIIAVERAAVHHGDEARAVPRVGLDDGAQAGTGNGARPATCLPTPSSRPAFRQA